MGTVYPNAGSVATALPLFESALLSTRAHSLVQIATAPAPLIPARQPAQGEQYRFHFNMAKCIGCKCCVVACNEQNGNPAALNWRRVGELEGGVYPYAQRFHLSMGCNHCLEPSCLKGCPVQAYTKDSRTGVVLHNASTCIGCQYCTWNCSYGVPQYNAERGVVGKCDLCHNRLSDGMAPACVNACPEGALSIEIVNRAEWRANFSAADAPGLPCASDSISTTRVTLPTNLRVDLERVDLERVQPEHPHWPLVFMLVVTQLAVGAMAVLWLLDQTGGHGLATTAIAAMVVTSLGLSTSTLHLGRPIHAGRALCGLRTSWLSREVLTLSLFAGAAGTFTALLFLGLPERVAAGLAAALAGCAGVTSSARIYMVKARPAWNSGFTLVEFFSSAVLLGPLFVAVFGPVPQWVVWSATAGAVAQFTTQIAKLRWLSGSRVYELKASATLLLEHMRCWTLLRFALLAAAAVLAFAALALPLAFALALGGEWLGRYLFFVSVVPKNMAMAFAATERRAA